MAETLAEKNDRIARLVALSPTAKNNIEREAYHMSFPEEDLDGYIEPIKQEAFVGLVEDMATIGLYFTCPNEQIYAESNLILDGTVSVLEWIMPNTLYPKLRQYPALVSGIKTILEGVSDDPVIMDYLAYLGGGLGRSGLRPNLRDSCDYLLENTRVSGIFSEYLENMIGMIEDERVIQASIPTSIEEWNRFKEKVIERSAIACDAIIQSDTLSDPDDGRRLIMRMRTQLLQPFTASDLHDLLVFIYLTDLNTLSVGSRAIYDKACKEYYTGNKLYLEYYKAREIKTTGFDVLGFLILAYALSDTVSIFEQKATLIKQTYPMFSVIADWVDILIKAKESEHAE